MSDKLTGAIIGTIGFSLIWYGVNAYAAFGILIMIWGNNLERGLK